MSSISGLAASLTSAIEVEAKELEKARSELEREKEQLAEEKRRISSASSADLVKINVGGKVFQTHRSTLLSAEGTLLEAIFSGRWDASLARDELGNVFFDFDPLPFRALLNYLRTRSLAEPGQAVPAPQVPKEHEAQLERMIAYMGLQDVIQGAAQEVHAVPQEAMALRQAGCRDGGVAIAGGRLQRTLLHAGRQRCVVGGAPLLGGGKRQKLAWKVTVLQLHTWVLAGVTTNPAPPDTSYSDAGTYAWSSGGQVYSGGSQQGAADWPGWQTGDVSIFQLDALEGVLRLHLRRTGTVCTLRLPADQVHSASMHFNLLHAGDLVEVSQVTEQELSEAGL